MFIGAAVARGTGVATTSTGSSMSSLDRTLIKACRLWMIRFRAPLAHAALIDSDLLADCMQRSAKFSGKNKTVIANQPPRDIILSTEDDEEKMASENDVWTDDDIDEDEDYIGPPSSYKADEQKETNDTDEKEKVRAVESSYRGIPHHRGPQDFRRSFLLGFPTMEPPPSVIPEEDPEANTSKTSTDRDAVPLNGSDAESFITAAALERSTALERITEETRIYQWPIPGRPSSCGVYKVKGDTVLSALVERDEKARRLDFYFGPGTRRLAED